MQDAADKQQQQQMASPDVSQDCDNFSHAYKSDGILVLKRKTKLNPPEAQNETVHCSPNEETHGEGHLRSNLKRTSSAQIKVPRLKRTASFSKFMEKKAATFEGGLFISPHLL